MLVKRRKEKTYTTMGNIKIMPMKTGLYRKNIHAMMRSGTTMKGDRTINAVDCFCWRYGRTFGDKTRMHWKRKQ